MTGRNQIEGYNLIQCDEVSSSSDVLILKILRNPALSFFPSGRQTYQRYPANSREMIPHITQPQNVDPFLPPPGISNRIESLSTRTALVCVVLIFVGSIFLLSLVYASFPQFSEEERGHLRIPWNIDQAKKLAIVLDHYKEDHYFLVMVAVCVTYIFLQTFAIPGSLFLSILSGFLFPFLVALILVCTCSTIGASLCFLLSQLLGRKLLLKYFPERINKWGVIVNKQRDNLFNYVLFLRITPILPNWFINLTAPVIGVPLKPFAWGTFFGVAPPSFVAIQTGQTLFEMTASDSTFSSTSIILLGIFAIFSLIPIFFKQRIKDKFE